MNKVCTKCLVEQPITEFNKSKSHKNGIMTWCRKCTSDYNKKKYEEGNPEERFIKGRKWRENNKPAIKLWKNENPEKIKLYYKSWRDKNIEKERERNRAWCKNNPESDRIRKQRRRSRKNSVICDLTSDQINLLKEEQNFTCLRCGKREPEIKLSLDHIIPLFSGGATTLENSQLLCVSCNSSKGTKVIDYRRSTKKAEPTGE